MKGHDPSAFLKFCTLPSRNDLGFVILAAPPCHCTKHQLTFVQTLLLKHFLDRLARSTVPAGSILGGTQNLKLAVE